MGGEIENVVFYDGDCGFCNSSVQFILKKRKREFYFAPLQSDFAKKTLKTYNIEIKLDTLYYKYQGKVYERSGAALRIARGLKGLWPVFAIFLIIPRFIRDWFYDQIAKRRHKIKNGFCALPSNKEKRFFINEL